jgi:3-phenylpropionate/trans-cinnamate dioxygenase ferredoxin reductase subunit
MKHYQYLIVGGGMTADAAARGIRQVDSSQSIGLLSAEPDPPYNRPPLSKGLWKGKPIDRIWRRTEDLGVELHLGHKAVRLDPHMKQILTEDQQIFSYERLLLATGGKPRRLPFGGDQIMTFRTLADYRELERRAAAGHAFAIIGGGFIGSELAAALRSHDCQVTLIFPETGIGSRTFPPDLTSFLNDYYRERGVQVISGRSVKGVDLSDDKLQLQLDNGDQVDADSVLAGIGISPNVRIAQEAGLKVDDGIIVDSGLRTSQPDIYAAGDVARYYNSALEATIRFEHEDNANSMGLAAGRAMAGEPVAYDHLPYFYSDLFDLGYEAVGELNPSFDIVPDWIEPFQKGVIYYLRQGRVRGALLWNVWDQVPAARQVINQAGPITPDKLVGRIGR